MNKLVMSPVWRPNCAPMLGAADKFYSLFFIDLYLFDLDQYMAQIKVNSPPPLFRETIFLGQCDEEASYSF